MTSAGTGRLLNRLSARIEDEVLEFLPVGHPVHRPGPAATRCMLDQVLTLVDLAETAADEGESL